jgi:hypothetical protein
MQRHEGRQHRLVKRVAIRRRISGRAGGDAAAGARAIDHDNLLAPEVGEFLGDETERDVRRAAGR